MYNLNLIAIVTIVAAFAVSAVVVDKYLHKVTAQTLHLQQQAATQPAHQQQAATHQQQAATQPALAALLAVAPVASN